MASEVTTLKAGKLSKELLEKTEEESKKKAKAQAGTELCLLIVSHVNDIERVPAYCDVILPLLLPLASAMCFGRSS